MSRVICKETKIPVDGKIGIYNGSVVKLLLARRNYALPVSR